MNITIGQVSIKDLDRILEIEKICFPEAEAAGKKSLEQRIKTFPQNFFTAKADGKIIGFINGCVINENAIYDRLYEDCTLHIPDGDYQTILGLDVIPEYRNLGVASLLMHHMIETSKKSGRKGIILTCKKRLIHYYEKFGYVNKGISESVHGGVQWYNMILKI